MNNLKGEGQILTLTAPSGGVVSGTLYLIGSLAVVAMVTAAQDEPFAARVTGVVEITKTGSQAWTEGAKIYRNAATGAATTDGTTGPLIGIAAAAVGSGAGETLGLVRLNGVPAEEAEGQQAAIADLTFGTNIAASTANGALTDSSATNPTEAQFNELAKELGVKINAILAVMRTKGDIAAA